MLVTCICVCHDKPDIAHEAIQSIISQRYPNWEALVVDSGVLYDAGYYDSFAWRRDARVKLIRSDETEEVRRTKAMAPWCFNECFRKGLVSGDLVMYLCDDDILYPNAFETFVTFSRQNPHVKAMYASQDIAVIYPNGWRSIAGERHATETGGICCGGRIMDCRVDYLQLCHKPEVLTLFPDEEYWPEGKETESHADGIFMERIGKHIPIHPIDVKISQNRRSLRSTYNPIRPFALIDCMANGVPLTAMRRSDEELRCSEGNATVPRSLPATRLEEHAQVESGVDLPFVTVSVTGRSTQYSLRETLTSLDAQTYPRLEVLVIEDRNADRRPNEAVQQLKELYPGFRFVSGDALRDRGLWDAKGVYFIPMEAGAQACPTMVERFVEELRAKPDLSALTCYVAPFARGAGGPPAHTKNIYAGGIFHTTNLQAVGGFGVNHDDGCPEWAGFLSLVNAGYKVGILPEHLFYFGNGLRGQHDGSDAQSLQRFFNADRLAAAERVVLWDGMADLRERMEAVVAENQALKTRIGAQRYRIADRINGCFSRLPLARRSMKWLLSMLA
jgi:glycosyltransferase involved in cell wall biosynthesis